MFSYLNSYCVKISSPLVIATAPVLEALTSPSGVKVTINLSISLLKAVTWITKEFFDLSNTKELYFFTSFLGFFSIFFG